MIMNCKKENRGGSVAIQSDIENSELLVAYFTVESHCIDLLFITVMFYLLAPFQVLSETTQNL